MRMHAQWAGREKDRAGNFAIPFGTDMPPHKLITPRPWMYDVYREREFERTGVNTFIVPQPYQKPMSKMYGDLGPWQLRPDLKQGRTRLTQQTIHRAQTATARDTTRCTSPTFKAQSPRRSPFGGPYKSSGATAVAY
jgi:hypothetical protein